MENKRIFQTFNTAPMLDDWEQFYYNIKMAALSLAFAKQSGYYVVMYTDTKGYEYLKQFPYDEIYTLLDSIPKIKKPEFLFSIGKYYAMKQEPLGSIHMDYDIFLKKPCLDKFYEDKSIDIILQCRELIADDGYIKARDYIFSIFTPKCVDLSGEIKKAYNVGIFGFNNQELKDKFLEAYFEIVNGVKDYDLETWIDFLAEQAVIEKLCVKMNIKPFFLIDVGKEGTYDDWNLVAKIANKIGYCHLQSKAKYDTFWKKRVEINLKDKFPEYWNIIKKFKKS